MNNSIYIYGATAHAKMVADLAEDLGFTIQGFVDKSLLLEEVFDYSVALNHEHQLKDETVFVAVKNAGLRCRLVGENPQWKAVSLLSKQAFISKRAEIGEGTVVMPGAYIAPDVQIGDHCVIGSSAVIESNTIIEDFVNIGANTTIGSNVLIGRSSEIQSNCFIDNERTIAKESFI